MANAGFWGLTEGVAPELLAPPVNAARLFLHPDGLAPRILNFDEWGRHVLNAVRDHALRNPDERLEALLPELEDLVGDIPPPGPDHVGFAVPLGLRSGDGELRLLTTLTYFGTPVDVAIAELRLEALPADEETAASLAALAS